MKMKTAEELFNEWESESQGKERMAACRIEMGILAARDKKETI